MWKSLQRFPSLVFVPGVMCSPLRCHCLCHQRRPISFSFVQNRPDEVRVIRSWKGPHHSGDTLTFGVPFGRVSCEPTTSEQILSWFDVTPDGSWFRWDDPDNVSGVDVVGGPNVFMLFLRRPDNSETRLIQGLLPAAGEGLQGRFAIRVP
jgi:hypothetical protein